MISFFFKFINSATHSQDFKEINSSFFKAGEKRFAGSKKKKKQENLNCYVGEMRSN